MKSTNQNPELAVAAPVAQNTQDFLPAVLEAAKDPNVEAAKLESLWRLALEIRKQRAEDEFHKAFRIVQSQMPPIVKSSRNPSTDSNFAKFEKIQDILNPLLAVNNLTISYGTDESKLEGHYGVTADLTYTSPDQSIGSFKLHKRCDVPADTHGMKGTQNKTPTHGMGSALSYGQRYLVTLLFNIRLIGADDDGNWASRRQAQESAISGQGDERDLKKKLVDLTRSVHGVASGYAIDDAAKQKLAQFLWDESFLSDTEALSKIPLVRLREVVDKLQKKLNPR